MHSLRETSLRSVAAVFLVFGAFWGAFAIAAADIEQDLGVSHGAFGLLLSVALSGAAVSNAVGGALAERRGTGMVLSLALAGWAAATLAVVLVRPPVLLGVTLVVAVMGAGLVDVVMNVAATAALVDRPGALVRFHALFNTGAGLGAGLMGVLLGFGHSWRWAWVLVAVLAVAVAPTVRSLPASATVATRDEPASLFAVFRLLRREHLVLLALAFATAAMVEGGVELWGVLFLRSTLPSGLAVGAVSAVIAYAIAATARVVIGPRAGRRGAARGISAGAGVAAVGLLILVLVDVPVVAGAGLVLAAGGISMCWPLFLAHASAGRERPGTIVGGVSSIGYLGFVLGPTIVGWMSALVGLRAGLLVLAVAAVAVAVRPNLRR